jgi:hypothetical protein
MLVALESMISVGFLRLYWIFRNIMVNLIND